MDNNLSIKTSASEKAILFTTQMAGSIGIGLVASRLFKNFSPAHGAAMGALYGSGATVAVINSANFYSVFSKKQEIKLHLDTIAPSLDSLLDDVEAVAKNEAMNIKQHEVISKKFNKLIALIPNDYPEADKERGAKISEKLNKINYFSYVKKLATLADRLDAGIVYLTNREDKDKEYNQLEGTLKNLDRQVASCGKGMLLGLGLAVLLPLLTKRFGFPMNGKILSRFVGAQAGATVLFNLIGSALIYKNPIAVFRPEKH